MFFNSFSYILVFLPLVFLIFFSLAKYINYFTAKVFLLLASLFFYAWWSPVYLPLLLLSIFVNYSISRLMQRNTRANARKYFLIVGVIFNLGLLAYFKYANFLVNNLDFVLHSHLFLKEIILPLGISFFSFTQIAFLVDVYRDRAAACGILNYSLFVSYFPHLLAGPIIHHAQMMPHFANEENARINYKNIYLGLVLFIIGLSKKVVVADTFAIFANQGYANTASLSMTTAWVTSMAYTFQIYFDFSGYTDMAIGASKLFNIDLPINFNSPYQSLSIRDFWHRWHITLSHFLRDYLYIPLGGNRVSEMNVYRNLLLTFMLGGLWHGAGWTFVMWGLMHGMGLSIQRGFGKLKIVLPKLFCWFMTFNFINVTWIFFRADSFQQASEVLTRMFDFSTLTTINPMLAVMMVSALLMVGVSPNAYKIVESRFAGTMVFVPLISTLMLIAIIAMQISNSHAFIYFHF